MQQASLGIAYVLGATAGTRDSAMPLRSLPSGGKQKVNKLTNNAVPGSTKVLLLVSKPSIIE